MKYYIESNKRMTKKSAIVTALITLFFVLVLSTLVFFFVDKMMGISLLILFLFFIVINLLICLFAQNNNVEMPYIEIKDEYVVIFNQNSKEQNRIPLSNICSAEITTAYRYRLHTIPEGQMRRYKQSIFSMIFEPKYIVFYDVGFNYLFGIYLCKDNYEAFKSYLPQSQQNIKFS